jgi:hypothetical protein
VLWLIEIVAAGNGTDDGIQYYLYLIYFKQHENSVWISMMTCVWQWG